MTREEAINIVRNIYQTDKEKAALEVLIPELKESEDERMLREIKRYIKEQGDKPNGLPNGTVAISDMIAWLEKQKEQNSVDEQFPPLDGLDAIKAKYYDDGFKNGFDEGVASVKPAEWSEEDEKKIIFLESLIEFNVPDGQYGWVDGMKSGFVTKSEAISMLKSLRPSWKPSQEQMYALLNAEGFLRAGLQHDSAKIIADLYEQLKKL